MDRILITGVAGFLGSNLANELIKNEKNLIYGIDNFSSGSMSNLYPLLKNERFEFLEHDLTNDIPLKVDYIYHLAGNGDMRYYFSDKYKFITQNLKIFENIINFTINQGAKLVLTTSYLDYQEQNKEIFKYYDYLKLTEDLALELITKNQLNAQIARLDNIYGKNLLKDDNRELIKILFKAFKNEKIEIAYDESFYYTFANDVSVNLIKMMNNFSNSPILDVSSENLYLKSDIIKLIIAYTKSSSTFEQKTQIVHHPNYKPSPTNNLKCETTVLDGILNTIKWFKLIYFS